MITIKCIITFKFPYLYAVAAHAMNLIATFLKLRSSLVRVYLCLLCFGVGFVRVLAQFPWFTSVSLFHLHL